MRAFQMVARFECTYNECYPEGTIQALVSDPDDSAFRISVQIPSLYNLKRGDIVYLTGTILSVYPDEPLLVAQSVDMSFIWPEEANDDV